MVSSALPRAQGQAKTGVLDRWLAVLGIGSVPSPRPSRGTSCGTETVVFGQESQYLYGRGRDKRRVTWIPKQLRD